MSRVSTPPVPALRVQSAVEEALPNTMPPMEREPSSVRVAAEEIALVKLATPSAPEASTPPCQLAVAAQEPPPAAVQALLSPRVTNTSLSP